jgi:hypothetical protein
MANTIFLVDLYVECINLGYPIFGCNKLVEHARYRMTDNDFASR